MADSFWFHQWNLTSLIWAAQHRVVTDLNLLLLHYATQFFKILEVLKRLKKCLCSMNNWQYIMAITFILNGLRMYFVLNFTISLFSPEYLVMFIVINSMIIFPHLSSHIFFSCIVYREFSVMLHLYFLILFVLCAFLSVFL